MALSAWLGLGAVVALVSVAGLLGVVVDVAVVEAQPLSPEPTSTQYA